LLMNNKSMSTSSSNGQQLNPEAFAGTWKGKGTIFPAPTSPNHLTTVPYDETAVFEVVRKTPDFVVYRVHQDTKHGVEKDKPMHTETGFLKIMADSGDSTMQVVHPFPKGFVSELTEGRLVVEEEEGGSSIPKLKLKAKEFQRAKSDSSDDGSKSVTGLERHYKVLDDGGGKVRLVYEQYLSSGGRDPFHHLHCEMTKQEEGE